MLDAASSAWSSHAVTTCDVCGTANEPSLTFCRHCGNRLKAKAAAAPAEEPSEAPARRSRPPAPALELKRRKRRKAPRLRAKSSAADEPHEERDEPARAEERADEVTAPPVTIPRDSDEAAALEARRRCGRCGASNPRGYRFCISCGAVLSATGEVRPYKAEKVITSVGGLGPEEKAAQAKAAAAQAAPAQAQERASKHSQGVTLKAADDALAEVASGARAERARKQPKHQRAQRPVAQRQEAQRQEAQRQAARPDTAEDASGKEPFPLAERALKGKSWHQRRESTEQSRMADPSQRESPRRASPAVTGQLVIIVEDGSEGQRLDLSGERVDLGRSEGDIVLPEDRYLSPRHARFYRVNDRWYVRDLSSYNGIYKRLRQRASLRHGDRILLGLEVLELDILSEQERSLQQAIQHGVLAFGSPATKRRARLLQRTVEGVVRDVYHLVATETTIGRETGDIVFTSDPFMSRRHAAISYDDQSRTFSLADLGSSNGTYLAMREDVALQHGDYIRLGQHLFRVDLPRRAKSR